CGSDGYLPGSGMHKLWMVLGGSVGYGSLSALDIDEGLLADDFTGRKWQVSVAPAGVAREEKQTEKEQKKTAQKERTAKANETKFLIALDLLVERMKNDEQKYPTKRQIGIAAGGINNEVADQAIWRLTEAKIIETVPVIVRSGKN